MEYRNAAGFHWWSHTTGSKRDVTPYTSQTSSCPFWQCIQIDWKGWTNDFQDTKLLRAHLISFIWLMTFTLSEINTFEVSKEQTLSWENSECWILPWGERGFKLEGFCLPGLYLGKKKERLSRHMQNKQIGNHLCSKKRWRFWLFHVVNALISPNRAFLNLLNTGAFT